MASDKTIEERLAALEAAVAELQRRLNVTPAGNWSQNLVPAIKDEDVEAFNEAMEYGREYRRSHFPPELEEEGAVSGSQE